MWSVPGFGITFVILLSCGEIRARVIPETTSDRSTEESTANRYKFLDQVSASKIECLLKFIEQHGAIPECIDTLFGDERSQFLLDELSRELAGESYPNGGMTNDEEDKNDQLVADLNTLSEKAGILSTVNDDVPMINSNKDKRVEEQVDTPKKEEQIDGDLQQKSNEGNVAEVVKSVHENEDNEKNKNGIDNADEVEDDYEYDSSLVSKLYNMLQDLVMKETFDYGLNMDEDDDDSDEEQPENVTKTREDVEEDDNANVGDQENKNIKFKGQMFGGKQQNVKQEVGSDSEEEEEDEEGVGQVENEISAVKVDENDDVEEDEIEKELKRMQGTQTDGERKEEEEDDDDDDDDDDDGGDDNDAENVAELENDLVQELDRMLSMARQAGGKGKTSYKTDVDVVSNDKFLEDLRNMEKQLKKSSEQ